MTQPESSLATPAARGVSDADQALRAPWGRLLTGEWGRNIDPAIAQFGYDLFAATPTTFAPVTEIPVPPEYVLGPGDELQLQFYGSRDDTWSVVVDREGVINLPGVGPLVLAGMSFTDAKALISEQVRRKLIGVTASITMGRLRSMRVFVLGDVNHPGSYVVSGLSTISNALFVAGGIGKQGSLRHVQLKRTGKVAGELDLYDFLLKGDSRADQRLQAGDVIFVPPIGNVVAVAGDVVRPAIYELRGEKTVADMLALAAGPLPTADAAHAQLDRITETGDRSLLDVDLTASGGATPVKNGDLLVLYPGPGVRENVVDLRGQVKRPGSYGWTESMKLSDLLGSVDALLPDAHRDTVLVARTSPDDRALTTLRTSLTDLLVRHDTAADLLLEPEDVIYVFSQAAMRPLKPVHAIGHLRHPGEFPHADGMRLLDLVMAAGGPDEQAYLGEAEITRYEVVDGDRRVTSHLAVNLVDAMGGQEAANVPLMPYDELIVRAVTDWKPTARVTLGGEVRFPGVYPVEEGERLSSVIARAGGYTDKAYLPAAVFTREVVRAQQQRQLDEMANRIEADIGIKEAELSNLRNAQILQRETQSVNLARQVLAKMRTIEANGRMVIELQPAAQLKDSEWDLALQDGDRLHVPQKPDQVLVIGQTYNNTALIYREKLDRTDYVALAGGPTRFADTKRVYVVRANGEVDTGRSSSKIRPGDAIVVPEKIERLYVLDSMLDWSQVLMNIGIGVASMKTIGVF
ncbi:MAG: SLBB domain-containing protein [Nitrospirae bacterium]|nr:SLBB domain-containing protein [Nitrospirota bacterium]